MEDQKISSQEQKRGRGNVVMSKWMYEEIGERAEAEFGEGARVKRILREVMGFDPEASTYRAERLGKIQEWRKKKAEELGLPIGAVCGGKVAKAAKEKAMAKRGQEVA